MSGQVGKDNLNGNQNHKRRAQGLPQNAEKTRLQVRSFFIFFLFGNLTWMILVSIAAAITVGPCSTDAKCLLPLDWNFAVGFCDAIGTCGLISGASLIAGGLLGFLFGIPRSLASSAAAIAQQITPTFTIEPNTNLEQISDWLTKVLVGVGLTQISDTLPILSKAKKALSPIFGQFPDGGIVGLAIIFAFGIGGFIWAYFESRTSLMDVFADDTQNSSAIPVNGKTQSLQNDDSTNPQKDVTTK